MFKFFSHRSQEQKLKAEREAALKQSLADKLARYEQNHNKEEEEKEESDFTLVTVGGRKRLVRTEEITLQD